ncbi:hypothetical protein [Streptomyces sp. S.PB5]|uniref:hypothetical protein n=1 Tax=Streptomyces sp. S.PB5 TaxID=3020844 RepID=UPI0025AFA307|nr:hypothetical protein [Streptomyces sp. S.PB5]MDN3026502.1 hypothetical protein [Streptomyces sp. S.PB5]
MRKSHKLAAGAFIATAALHTLLLAGTAHAEDNGGLQSAEVSGAGIERPLSFALDRVAEVGDLAEDTLDGDLPWN